MPHAREHTASRKGPNCLMKMRSTTTKEIQQVRFIHYESSRLGFTCCIGMSEIFEGHMVSEDVGEPLQRLKFTTRSDF